MMHGCVRRASHVCSPSPLTAFVEGVAGKGGLNMAILGEIPIGALRRANAFDPSSLYPIGLIQFTTVLRRT